ncbi:MAG: SAM-dependent chlorinase/fluorinase [Anaerolineales bacterium]|nr:SAM-dependent chlorinase/fluorinase [Anaerolineales bacterium]
MQTKNHTLPTIALLTDFGLTDSYVGVMKGVILSICPIARLIDVTHAITPQNVRQGAYVLLNTLGYMPPQTVYVGVVDPGVGSARQSVAIKTNRAVFVGPDNGLFSYALKHCEIQEMVILQNPQYLLATISSTFHGRDIFSPVAAHIACGVPLDQLGPSLTKLEALPPPRLEITPQAIYGEVLDIDHFGNVATSIGRLTWGNNDLLALVPFFDPQPEPTLMIEPERCTVQINHRMIDIVGLTFASVPRGELIALINSADQLEIAINHGNAAHELGVQIGDPVILSIN